MTDLTKGFIIYFRKYAMENITFEKTSNYELF